MDGVPQLPCYSFSNMVDLYRLWIARFECAWEKLWIEFKKGKNINNHRNDSRNRFIHPSSHHALYAGITNPIHSNLYLFIPQSSDSISHNFMHFNHQGINKTNQNNLLSFSLIFSRISLNHSFIRNQDKQRALQNAIPRNGRNNRLLSKRRTCRICWRKYGNNVNNHNSLNIRSWISHEPLRLRSQ